MVFSSIIFLFLYLPLVLGIYHLIFLPVTLGIAPAIFRRLSNLFLLTVSLLFYFWGEQFLVWIIIVSTLIDYICGLLISGAFHKGKIELLSTDAKRLPHQKFGLILSVVSNLAFLGVFKYFNFGIDSYNACLDSLGLSSLMLKDVIKITLPLGISFYTFQSMSYTIDVYRANVKATRNIIDFACYVTMFPQLVAGPIVRYRDIAKQLITRTMNISLFSAGVERFIIGLGKKVLIANTVSSVAEEIFKLPPNQLTTPVAWLGVAAYTIQIYFDFSGYSDMAIGLGKMLGFDFRENFNYPYIASSVKDFWRRWHISLSTWFRDYLYIPLGGSRKTISRTYINLIIVFFLCGLWHGASWNFVVWGLYHGFFLVIERTRFGSLVARNKIIAHIYTLIVVMVGWVIFQASSLSHALVMIAAMFGFSQHTSVVVYDVNWYMQSETTIAFIAGIIFSMPIIADLVPLRQKITTIFSDAKRPMVDNLFRLFNVIMLIFIMILCAMYLSAGTHNPFIYFRF